MHILIVGAGSIGQRHLRNFLKIDGVRCSVVETNPETLKRISFEYPLQKTFTDYHLAPLDKIDGVVICIPTHLHIPAASYFVERGVNILLEKPLSMTLQGVEDLQLLLERKNIIFSVAYTLRSDPMYRELRDRILAGEAGFIGLVRFYVGQFWPRMRNGFPPEYARSRVTGGGAIPDHLIHIINFLEWCFGPPAAISASHWNLGLPDIVTEDTASVILKFGSGTIAQLGICLFQQDNTMEFQFIGKKSTIQLCSEKDFIEIFDVCNNTWERGAVRRSDRDKVFMFQAQHFLDCIRGESLPRCTFVEAVQTLKTMLVALRSGDSDSRFIGTS